MRLLSTVLLLCASATIAVAVSACHPTGTYRSVNLPDRPGAAQARVVQELKSRGYRITSTGTSTDRRRVTITAVRQWSHRPPAKPPTKKGSPASAPAPAEPLASKRSGKKGPTLTAILYPRHTGTRVLLHASSRYGLGPIFSKSKHRDYKPGFGVTGKRILWEIYAGSGYRYAPDYGHSLAMQAGARLGYRIIRLGGGTDTPEPQVSVGLALGLGGGWSTGDEHGYALPSLTLSYLIRRTVEPIPGEVIPIGPELNLDFHIVGVLSPRRTGLEGQLVLRYSDVIGIYVGAGYQWLPTPGATFTVGLHLSTVGVAAAVLLGALAL